jgi:GT2 family glycosyltransferase
VTAISVCVPVYRAHAEPNLSTLAARLRDALDGLDGELVVALNGVAPSSVGVSGDMRVVDLGVNRGVAPGWNAAAHAADGDVLVFANDDVVLGPRSLATLHRALVENPEAGVVGPVGARWDVRRARHVSDVVMNANDVGAVERCDAVAGFLFAVRRAVFDQAGGFDEAYAPCSFEEVDFCAAVTRRLGLTAYAVGGVDVEHVWGISRRSAPWKRVRFDGHSESLRSIHRRNRRHFLAKWGDPA